MPRLRYNNMAGSLGAALTTTGTQLTFATVPSLATLTGTDYIPVVLDPPQGPASNPNFEVAYITAYTAGQSTATILRGQEGTTGKAHNQGAVWAQAPTQFDLVGDPPVGALLPYTGSGDPPEGVWIIADGRLIDRTQYSDFYGRTGHKYNLGVDPGSNKVKIPDKRGKKSVGAINMGSSAGAGANDNSHLQAVAGSSYGEVNHALIAAENGPHSHGGATGTGTTSGESNTHVHGLNHPYLMDFNPGGAISEFDAGGTGQSGATGIARMYAESGIVSNVQSSGHTHTVSAPISTDGSGTAHNNIDPAEADCWIVRIA